MSYPTHVPLSGLQKAAVAVLSAVVAAQRPARADLVAALGETTGYAALQALRRRMASDSVGKQILQDRPRITDATVELCRHQPAGSFGAAYFAFMNDRNFSADERPPVRFVDDDELAYVITRVREIHDLWHTVFDCHTNVFGELALKGVEFVQTGLPMTALSVVGAQWRLPAQDRALLQATYLPWAWRAGTECRDLVTIYYERHWGDDLETLRKEWNILRAPQPPPHLQPKWMQKT